MGTRSNNLYQWVEEKAFLTTNEAICPVKKRGPNDKGVQELISLKEEIFFNRKESHLIGKPSQNNCNCNRKRVDLGNQQNCKKLVPPLNRA